MSSSGFTVQGDQPGLTGSRGPVASSEGEGAALVAEPVGGGPEADPRALANLRPSSPYRPPDWRWQLAEYLIGHPRSPMRQLADDRTRQALDYLRDLGRLRSERGRAKLQLRLPDVHAAWAIAKAGPWGGLSREIEARLLAGQDDAATARRCGLDPGAVAAFADLHFDVRPRLQVTAYIVHSVIGVFHGDRRVELERERLLKLMAYRGGPLVLDVILEALGMAGTAPGGDVQQSPPGLHTGLASLLLLVIGLDDVDCTPRQLMGLYARVSELRRAELARDTSAITGPLVASGGLSSPMVPSCPSEPTRPSRFDILTIGRPHEVGAGVDGPPDRPAASPKYDKFDPDGLQPAIFCAPISLSRAV